MNKVIYEGEWQFPVRKEFVLDSSISVGARLLYIAIKSYCAPNQSTAFPSSFTLANAMGVTKVTIRKWARELEAKGLLKRTQEKLPGGIFSHTLWRLYGSCSHENI
jgi:hypothetical protein